MAEPGAIDGISTCFTDTGSLSAAGVIEWMADISREQFARLGLGSRACGPVADTDRLAERVLRGIEVHPFTDRCIVSTCPDLRLLIDYISATESAGMAPHLFGVSWKYPAHLVMDWGPRNLRSA